MRPTTYRSDSPIPVLDFLNYLRKNNKLFLTKGKFMKEMIKFTQIEEKDAKIIVKDLDNLELIERNGCWVKLPAFKEYNKGNC